MLEGKESEAQAAVQASSNVLVCREHDMNPSKVSAWHCLPMRRVSSMTCTLIATDQRGARECKEEKGRERQALPLGRV